MPHESCRFCQQGVKLILGEHFDDYARQIREFDSFTFWEFVSQKQEFLKIGHYASDRTPNHYFFRIMAEPIFEQHSYDLSVRIKNALTTKGILTSWVQKIVCTDGEESKVLSTALANVIGLRADDVVSVPRSLFTSREGFTSFAGKQPNQELQTYMNSHFGEGNLRRRNILILDQAAHHFQTLAALRNICEFYDCTVLAFAVFVDRTDGAFSLGDYLYDSHYLPLYSWPVPPRRSYECVCSAGLTE